LEKEGKIGRGERGERRGKLGGRTIGPFELLPLFSVQFPGAFISWGWFFKVLRQLRMGFRNLLQGRDGLSTFYSISKKRGREEEVEKERFSHFSRRFF
jgi:hypothetical protein